jgi:RNA polymerase sigma-70 factor, ECF subfamily
MSAVTAAAARPEVDSSEAYAADLYERHQRAILGFCMKQLRRREDADDAVQTTFVYALLSLRRGVVPQLELPWLLTIARNVCSTRRRSGMRRGTYETPQDLESIQDRLAAPERADVSSEELTAALRAIPDRQRTALLLREFRGLSYDEIGSELGLSQAATEALLFRARQSVAQRLSGAVKLVNGMPLVSFVRNLLQSAAAKTLALGAGTAIAVVAVPAAQPKLPHDANTTSPAPVVTPAAATADAHTAHPQATIRLGTATKQAATRQNGTVVRPRGAHPDDAETKGAVTPAATPPAVASVDPGSSTKGTTPAPAPAPATTPVDDTVQTVVDTASDVTTSVGLPPVSLPPVSVPPLSTPSVTLPVQTPALPSVQLP